MKLIKSSATLTTVKVVKLEHQQKSFEGLSFSQRLSHNVFLTTFSLSIRYSQNITIYDKLFCGKPPKITIVQNIAKILIFEMFKKVCLSTAPKCSSHVPKQNIIHRGIREHSSVQNSAPWCRQTDRRT